MHISFLYLPYFITILLFEIKSSADFLLKYILKNSIHVEIWKYGTFYVFRADYILMYMQLSTLLKKN